MTHWDDPERLHRSVTLAVLVALAAGFVPVLTGDLRWWATANLVLAVALCLSVRAWNLLWSRVTVIDFTPDDLTGDDPQDQEADHD